MPPDAHAIHPTSAPPPNEAPILTLAAIVCIGYLFLLLAVFIYFQNYLRLQFPECLVYAPCTRASGAFFIQSIVSAVIGGVLIGWAGFKLKGLIRFSFGQLISFVLLLFILGGYYRLMLSPPGGEGALLTVLYLYIAIAILFGLLLLFVIWDWVKGQRRGALLIVISALSLIYVFGSSIAAYYVGSSLGEHFGGPAQEYVYQQNQRLRTDDTYVVTEENWATHTDEKLGFSVAHPEVFDVIPTTMGTSNDEGYYIDNPDGGAVVDGTERHIIKFKSLAALKQERSSDSTAQTFDAFVAEDASYKTLQKTTFAGQPVYQGDDTQYFGWGGGNGYLPAHTTIFEYKGAIYRLVFVSPYSPQITEVDKKIRDSFTLLN